MKLVRAEELSGRSVVAIDTGESVAQVRDVVYDATTHDILGFTLSGTGFMHRRSNLTLPAHAVESIGPDAIMIRDPAVLVGADAEPAEGDAPGTESGDAAEPDDSAVPSDSTPTDLRRSGHPVVGTAVLSADGRELGQITSVILDIEEKPRAVGYELRVDGRDGACFVPISAQVSVSNDNVVIRDDGGDLLTSDLDGLESTFSSPAADDGKAGSSSA